MSCSQTKLNPTKIILKKLLVVLAAGSVLVPISYANSADGADGKGGQEACGEAITEGGDGEAASLLSDTQAADEAFQASIEERSLLELTLDSKDNLAVNHPFVIMTAAQRIYSFIQSQGYEVMNIRGVGEVRVYDIFSVPSEMNGGKIIVGHEREIEQLVDSLKDAIDGDVKVPFLVGPSGTGKTLIQDIFRQALAEVTLNYTKQFYWTFEWKNLGDVEKTAAIYPSGTYRAPLGDSPITLLPVDTQKKVVQFASRHLQQEISIVGNLDPISTPDPHSEWIRTAVLEHYTKEKGSPLTEKEIVESLDKHVIVRRQVLGSNGTAPVMDSQGRDYNQGDLFLSKDPVNSLVAPNKSADAIAWNFGKVPKANGSVLFLDEFPRNDKTLRDIFLRVFESHSIAISGAPETKVDAFIIAAGNYESLENLTGAEDSRAHRDRVRPIPFNWSIYPHKIAATLLYMYGRVYSRDLSDSNSQMQEANLLDIFPRTLVGDDYKGTDGRYEIWLGDGDNQVHLSPHALMLMSYIVSSTRLHYDSNEAIAKENTHTARTATYAHPVERIKYLAGKVNVSASEEEELKQQSMLQQEGHYGLSARDAASWLRKAVHVAQKDGGDVTPSIVMDTFRDMLDKGELEKDSRMTTDPDETRVLWNRIADMLAYQILLPELQQDFNSALASGTELAERTYDEVLQELIAVGSGRDTYKHPVNGTETPVKDVRLEEIREIYKDVVKKDLDYSQIATMFAVASQKMSTGGQIERDSSLMGAINQYFAQKTTESLDLFALRRYADTGQGEHNLVSSFNSLSEALKAKGYSDVGIRQTLALIEELTNKIAQAKKREQQRR